MRSHFVEGDRKRFKMARNEVRSLRDMRRRDARLYLSSKLAINVYPVLGSDGGVDY